MHEKVPVKHVEVLRGDEVHSVISRLAAGCQTSLWSFQPGGAQSRAVLQRARPLDSATLERGVQMRTLYQDSLRNDEATLEHAQLLTVLGAEIRTVPTLPLRMLLVDGALAVVHADPNDRSAGTQIIRSPGVVTGLAALFLSTWRSATPFGVVRPRRTGPFNAQEQQALELWAQGYTDAGVARRLGVSDRTVRRISTHVSSVLGASSRFQAGIRAAELGLAHTSDLP